MPCDPMVPASVHSCIKVILPSGTKRLVPVHARLLVVAHCFKAACAHSNIQVVFPGGVKGLVPEHAGLLVGPHRIMISVLTPLDTFIILVREIIQVMHCAPLVVASVRSSVVIVTRGVL